MSPAFQVWLLLALSTVVLAAPATVSFASYYGSHMVLQRAPEEAVIWGYAPGGSIVSFSVADSSWAWNVSVPVIGGLWRVQLPAIEAGGPFSVRVACGTASASLSDVWFGDVYVCSGQSNMGFTVPLAFNATAEIRAAASYPYIRLFTVQEFESDSQPLIDLHGVTQPWTLASPASVNGTGWSYFSATCWFFGRSLYDTLQQNGEAVPLGLFVSAVGGTLIEAWSSPQTLQQCGNGTAQPAVPRAGGQLSDPNQNPSSLYNSMIHPILNMTIRGIVWYQGEQNVIGGNYSCLFPAMVSDWRAKWSAAPRTTSPTMPFFYVQLASYCLTTGYVSYNCNNSLPISTVAPVRWAQTANLGTSPNHLQPNTYIATAIDLADPTSPEADIHPRAKQEVGRRLALAAAAAVYGIGNDTAASPFATAFLLSAQPPKNGSTIYCVKIQHANVGAAGLLWLKNNTAVLAHELLFGASTFIPAPIVSVYGAQVLVCARAPSSLGAPSLIRHLWRDRPCNYYNPAGGNCALYRGDVMLPVLPFEARL